ncbi:hypothetical protein GCM10010385_30640 [Streptomyces geysiriensis]|nr:hypothetical protein GCM10010385_30640 [Streptomyces geysiriensis]GGZ43013.1 hypothetical protein GCM10010301_14240 [Streptomyces plicatus]GHC12779.1 hypothetical protein GCM10010308_28960 [Streptomyces vinaceusdrappus]
MSASLPAATADHPLQPYRGRQPAAVGAPPPGAGGGPFGPSSRLPVMPVRSLDWQKLPGYW